MSFCLLCLKKYKALMFHTSICLKNPWSQTFNWALNLFFCLFEHCSSKTKYFIVSLFIGVGVVPLEDCRVETWSEFGMFLFLFLAFVNGKWWKKLSLSYKTKSWWQHSGISDALANSSVYWFLLSSFLILAMYSQVITVGLRLLWVRHFDLATFTR